MIPKRIKAMAYREKKDRRSTICKIAQEHNLYVVYLDNDKRLVLGKAKVNRQIANHQHIEHRGYSLIYIPPVLFLCSRSTPLLIYPSLPSLPFYPSLPHKTPERAFLHFCAKIAKSVDYAKCQTMRNRTKLVRIAPARYPPTISAPLLRMTLSANIFLQFAPTYSIKAFYPDIMSNKTYSQGTSAGVLFA